MAPIAFAGRLAGDTTVRIEASGIEIGWHAGKVILTGVGCTLFKLEVPTKNLIALIATT